MESGLIEKMFQDKMKLINRYLMKIGCSKEDADDIVQDTFYKALKYIDGIETDKLSSWLFKVAINKYYDLCRKNNRRTYLNIDEDIFKESLTTRELVENYLLNLEKKEEILKVLNSMNEIQKNLLLFKYEMGLSYKEIAEILDIGENTVKTYLFRAREQFKRIWRDRYE